MVVISTNSRDDATVSGDGYEEQSPPMETNIVMDTTNNNIAATATTVEQQQQSHSALHVRRKNNKIQQHSQPRPRPHHSNSLFPPRRRAKRHRGVVKQHRRRTNDNINIRSLEEETELVVGGETTSSRTEEGKEGGSPLFASSSAATAQVQARGRRRRRLLGGQMKQKQEGSSVRQQQQQAGIAGTAAVLGAGIVATGAILGGISLGSTPTTTNNGPPPGTEQSEPTAVPMMPTTTMPHPSLPTITNTPQPSLPTITNTPQPSLPITTTPQPSLPITMTPQPALPTITNTPQPSLPPQQMDGSSTSFSPSPMPVENSDDDEEGGGGDQETNIFTRPLTLQVDSQPENTDFTNDEAPDEFDFDDHDFGTLPPQPSSLPPPQIMDDSSNSFSPSTTMLVEYYSDDKEVGNQKTNIFKRPLTLQVDSLPENTDDFTNNNEAPDGYDFGTPQPSVPQQQMDDSSTSFVPSTMPVEYSDDKEEEAQEANIFQRPLTLQVDSLPGDAGFTNDEAPDKYDLGTIQPSISFQQMGDSSTSFSPSTMPVEYSDEKEEEVQEANIFQRPLTLQVDSLPANTDDFTNNNEAPDEYDLGTMQPSISFQQMGDSSTSFSPSTMPVEYNNDQEEGGQETKLFQRPLILQKDSQAQGTEFTSDEAPDDYEFDEYNFSTN